jgi:HK97 family phage major capsid protein
MNKTLLGYPVMVSIQALAATPVIFGDFSQYLLGMARDITIEIDRSNKFNVDAVVAKVTFRIAGGPACSLKVYDGETYGAFAVATENAPAS